ncbi:MAG TPA: gonadoliberin III, partial [Marinobacter sp.]|nr:gonadoliberin III [Marinobacter sp.]
PVLIAVAFVQTTLIPGLVAFLSVVSIGLAMRGYLSSLNLLLVSRISALIILVIFITAGLSIFGYQMGFNTGMTVTFFPMVIIAWTIERMSILWEEESGQEVLIQGSGSLFVAICAYLLMSAPLAGHLTFNFPELHFVVLGLILLMGQYTGYKLTELKRFTPMKAYD